VEAVEQQPASVPRTLDARVPRSVPATEPHPLTPHPPCPSRERTRQAWCPFIVSPVPGPHFYLEDAGSPFLYIMSFCTIHVCGTECESSCCRFPIPRSTRTRVSVSRPTHRASLVFSMSRGALPPSALGATHLHHLRVIMSTRECIPHIPACLASFTHFLLFDPALEVGVAA